MGFCHLGRGPVKIRSYTSFSIIIDLVIIDYISQFAKPLSFSRLVCVLLLDSFAIAGREVEVKGRFLLIAFRIGVLLYS